MQGETKFILDGVLQNCRGDGREVFMSRRYCCSTGTEVLAAGSCALALELRSPHIICGCKAEVADEPAVELH